MGTPVNLIRAIAAVVVGFSVVAATVLLSGELLWRYTDIYSVPMGSPIRYTPGSLTTDLIRALAGCVLGGLTAGAISNRWRLISVAVLGGLLLLLEALSSGSTTDYRPIWFRILAMVMLPCGVLLGGCFHKWLAPRLRSKGRLTA